MGVPKIGEKFDNILELFQLGVIRRFFLLKQKKYFVLGVPKVLREGVKLKFFFLHRGIPKVTNFEVWVA